MFNFSIAANFNFGRELKVVSSSVCSSLTTEATSRSSDFQWERGTNYETMSSSKRINKYTRIQITMSEHQETKTD